MQTAKLFRNGSSQAIRLPKEFRFQGKDVFIKSFEGVVLLIPQTCKWDFMIKSLDKFTTDFMAGYKKPKIQLRRIASTERSKAIS